ncbi:MAG: tetratricopeptide repeat protein [Planctomycetota bacterium]
MRLGWIAAVVLTALVGCQTNKKPISIREVVDDVEGSHSIVDTKITKYEKLVDQFPEEPKHRERLAAFYWQQENHQRALEELEIARKLDPENSKYDYMEGQIQQAIGNYNFAEVSYQRVIAKLPGDKFTGPHYDLADLYLETDQTQKAKAELEKCLEIDPSDPLAHFYLGTIAYETKKYDLTITHYERYMELGGKRFHDLVRRRLMAIQPELGRKRYTGE